MKHPTCTDGQYLFKAAPANIRGECKDQTKCKGDTYFQSSTSDPAGSCLPCRNAICLVGGQTTLTQFRTGVCDGITKGYTCTAQPTCETNQYLEDAGPLAQGTCADQPTCTNGEHLDGATPTSAGVCSSCDDGSFGGNRDGSCIECDSDPQCTAGAEYLTGLCAGKEDTRTCVACRNVACNLGQYRTGFCTGRDDDYVCVSQPVCEENYFLSGSDATTLGTCTQCKNAQCLATQYRTGACVPGADEFICNDQPTCTDEQVLTGGDTFTRGACTAIPTTITTSSSSTAAQNEATAPTDNVTTAVDGPIGASTPTTDAKAREIDSGKEGEEGKDGTGGQTGVTTGDANGDTSGDTNGGNGTGESSADNGTGAADGADNDPVNDAADGDSTASNSKIKDDGSDDGSGGDGAMTVIIVLLLLIVFVAAIFAVLYYKKKRNSGSFAMSSATSDANFGKLLCAEHVTRARLQPHSLTPRRLPLRLRFLCRDVLRCLERPSSIAGSFWTCYSISIRSCRFSLQPWFFLHLCVYTNANGCGMHGDNVSPAQPSHPRTRTSGTSTRCTARRRRSVVVPR